MGSRCEITGKNVMWGNKISHSNRKTSVRFVPNIQNVTVRSDALNKDIALRIAVSTLRTLDHNGGLDNFLVSTANKKLTEKARRIKSKVIKALSKQSKN